MQLCHIAPSAVRNCSRQAGGGGLEKGRWGGLDEDDEAIQVLCGFVDVFGYIIGFIEVYHLCRFGFWCHRQFPASPLRSRDSDSFVLCFGSSPAGLHLHPRMTHCFPRKHYSLYPPVLKHG